MPEPSLRFFFLLVCGSGIRQKPKDKRRRGILFEKLAGVGLGWGCFCGELSLLFVQVKGLDLLPLCVFWIYAGATDLYYILIFSFLIFFIFLLTLQS